MLQPEQSGSKAQHFQSGLVVKRPGMTDLNLDDLANCPTPDDALTLLSPGAAEAMQTIPEAARLEVCKTIVALGDVVARTHAPNLAAIKLTLREDGGIQATAEANGRIFHNRADNGVVAGITGAIAALARMESKQRTGKAHAGALDTWGNALIEAGQYLVEIAIISRGIAHEMRHEDGPPHIEPDPNRTVCPIDGVCVLESGHNGVCSTVVHEAPTVPRPEDAPPKFRSGITPVRVPTIESIANERNERRAARDCALKQDA